MDPIKDTQLKNVYTLKQMHIQMKMNVYKDFHIFACISVMKTYLTGLVLKDKNAQKLLKVFFIFLTNCINVLMIIFKNSQAYKRLQ